MGFFHRKGPRPSASSSMPSSSGATKRPPISTPSYDWENEETRVLFSNLNIRDQMPTPQVSAPSGPNPSSFLQTPPIVPSNPEFPSSPQFPVPSKSPAPPDIPSQPSFPSYPVFPEANAPSQPNFPSPNPPNFPSPNPPNFPSYPNFPQPPNFPSFESSRGSGSQSGITPPLPAGPQGPFPEYHGPNPMAFNPHGDINSGTSFPEYHGPNPMAFNVSPRSDAVNLNSFNVSNHTIQNSHNDNSVTHYFNSASSSEDGDENRGGMYQPSVTPPPSEPVPRGARLDLNLNLDASFAHPFANQQYQTSFQTSLQASMEAQRQQMLLYAAETKRHAEESAAQALRQAELAQTQATRMAEQLNAHAAEVRRQAEIASAQAATFRQASLEQRLAEAEVRRGEAEVRRREADQRRQETERRLQGLFATRPGTGTTVSAESSTGSGYVEHDVWAGAMRGPSQRVCMGYIEEEVRDEQGNPKWVSRLCGHEQCRNLYNK